MMSDRYWRTVWGTWIIYFGVAEWAALRSGNRKAPLSYFLRHSLGIPYGQAHQWAGRMVLGAGVIWLCSHLYEKNTD